MNKERRRRWPAAEVVDDDREIRATMELKIGIWLNNKLHPMPMVLNKTLARKGRPVPKVTKAIVDEAIRLLETSGKTQQEVGDLLGVSASTISSIATVIKACQ